MNNIKKYFLVYLLIALGIYLLGSFIAMDTNPNNWDIFGRAMSVTVLFLVVLAINVFEDNKTTDK